jgi:hypothetical protein
MWLGFVDFVVFPAQALWSDQSAVHSCELGASWPYLGYSKAPPFFLPKELQCALCGIEVLSRYSFEHRFR